MKISFKKLCKLHFIAGFFDLLQTLSLSYQFLSESRCSDVPPGSSLLSLHLARRADFQQVHLAAAAHPTVLNTCSNLFHVHCYSSTAYTESRASGTPLFRYSTFQLLFIVSLFCAWNITVEINSGVHLLKS